MKCKRGIYEKEIRDCIYNNSIRFIWTSTVMMLKDKTDETDNSNNNSNKNELNLSLNNFVFTGNDKVYTETYKSFELDFTNNSNYHIFESEIKFKVKSDISEKDEEKFKEILEDNPDDKPQDIGIELNFYNLLKKGETATDIMFYLKVKDKMIFEDFYKEHFDLMELTMLHLTLISEDNRIYNAKYNFNTSKWQLEELKYKNKEWPKEGIAQKIAIPNHDFVIVYPNSNSRKITVKIVGITNEDYKKYVDEIKKLGFTIDSESRESYRSGEYTAKNKDNDEIEIIYSDLNNAMLITARAY